MIGIDTNVLIRFLTQDDPSQSKMATALIARLTPDTPGFIAREVMMETVWVLERAYRFDRLRIAQALEGLLEAEELIIEAADQIGLALHRYAQGGAGFADHMIVAIGAAVGCDTVYTFDRKAGAIHGATVLT